jgi:hypothetical protein
MWVVVILARGLILLARWFHEEFIVAPREEKRIQQIRRARRQQAREAEQSVKQTPL